MMQYNDVTSNNLKEFNRKLKWNGLRLCKACRKFLTLDKYYQVPTRCITCTTELNKKRLSEDLRFTSRLAKLRLFNRDLAKYDLKFCNYCKKFKMFGQFREKIPEFNIRKFSSRCINCDRERCRKKDQKISHTEEFKDKCKNKTLMRDFGITLSDYNKMSTNQNDCCYTCGKHKALLSRGLYVDHCHRTGKIRSLLCSNCNSALGMCKESIRISKAITQYIIDKCDGGTDE